MVLVYSEAFGTLEAAIAREKQLKRWSGNKKEALIAGDTRKLKEFSRCRSPTHRDEALRRTHAHRYRAFRFSTLTMLEKSSVHNGVACGIVGTLQRASVASLPRSTAFLAITIHVEEKSSGLTL